MTAKLGRVVTYYKGTPCIKSHDPLVMWSRLVMWHIKNKISPLQLDVCPPNLAGWWLIVRVTYPWSCMTLRWRVQLRSCIKLKRKYLLFSKACSHLNLAGQRLMVKGTHKWSQKTLWSPAHLRSCNKWKT